MAIGVTLIIVFSLIALIWLSVEFKRFKHKFFAILLILLIIFSYFGFIIAIKGKDIDLKTSEGIKKAVGIYFSWLGHVFKNIKLITANAIKMDWKPESNLNQTKKTNVTAK